MEDPRQKRHIRKAQGAFVNYLRGEVFEEDATERYENVLRKLAESSPMYQQDMQAKQVEAKKAYDRALQVALEKYNKDPWSRRGLERAQEVEPEFPLGFSEHLLPRGAAGMTVTQRSLGKELPPTKFFYPGGTFLRPESKTIQQFGGPAAIIRHEGSHAVDRSLSRSEARVRQMDHIYGELYNQDLPVADPEHVADTWAKFADLMSMAKTHNQAERGAVRDLPRYQDLEYLNADNVDLTQLSAKEKLQLLNSSNNYTNKLRRSDGNHQFYRDLPHVGPIDGPKTAIRNWLTERMVDVHNAVSDKKI